MIHYLQGFFGGIAGSLLVWGVQIVLRHRALLRAKANASHQQQSSTPKYLRKVRG